MRASSSEQMSRTELPQGVRELKQQDTVDSRTLYQRLAEHQPREYQSICMEKSLTPNKYLPEYSRPIKNFSPVIANTESPDNEKQKYNEYLQISQKEIIKGRSSQSDQQTRFELIVKGQKLRMNELEIKSLKLSKELSSYKNSPKKDLSTTKEKESQIIFENQKRIKESEEFNKNQIHETFKQNSIEEIQNLRSPLNDSDSKLDIYEKEFNTIFSETIKSDDEFVFKGDFIKTLQDLVKEKEKTLEDLKNSNEKFLKMLEEKDQKVHCLEKDLTKEREQNKLLGDQLPSINIQKSPERKLSQKSFVPEKNYQSAKIMKHKQETHNYKGSIEKSPKKQKTSLIKQVGDGGLLKLQNQSMDLELKISNLTRENLQLKRYILNLDEKCQALQDDVKSYRSLLLRTSKDSTPKYRNDIKGDKTELQNKLTQVLKEKEKLEKFYRDLELEYEGKIKKLVEFESKNKEINERGQATNARLNHENDLLKKRLENEIKFADKIKNFISKFSMKLGLTGEQTDLDALGQELDTKIDELMKIGKKSNILSNDKKSNENFKSLEEKDSIIESLKLNLIQLESQVHELEENNFKISEEVNKLTKENLFLTQNFSPIIELLKPENPSSIESLQISIQAYKTFIEKRGIEAENLEIQISQNLSESIQHQSESKDLNEKLQTAKVDNLKLVERIKELENENHDLNEFVDDENMQSIEDSVVENEFIKNETEGKDAEIKALKDEINAETKELDIVKSLLNEKLIECEKNIELQQSLNKANSECKEKEAKIKLLEIQKKKLLMENEDLNNDVKCLKDDNFALHKYQDLDMINRLEKENEVMRERFDELEKDLNKKIEIIFGLNKKIEILEIGIIDKNESQGKDYLDMLDKIKSLESELSDKLSEIMYLNQELSRVNNTISISCSNPKSQSEEKLIIEDETCTSISGSTEKSKNCEPNSNNDLNLHIQIKNLSESLKEKEQKLKLAEAIQKNLRNENQEVQEDLKIMRNENYQLNRKAEQIELKNEESRQKIKELEENEFIFENEKKNFIRIQEELKEQNKVLVDELQDLNRKVGQVVFIESQPDLEAFKNLEKNNSNLNQELLSKQARIIFLEAEKRRLVKDAEEMENDLKDLRNHNFELHRNVEFIKQDFESEQLRTLNLKLEENEIYLKSKLNDSKVREKEMCENIIEIERKLNELQSVLTLKNEQIESQVLEIQSLNLRISEDLEKYRNQTCEKSEKILLNNSDESKINEIKLESNIKDLIYKVNELEKNLRLKEIKIKALEADMRISDKEMKENEILMKQIRAENFELHRRLDER